MVKINIDRLVNQIIENGKKRKLDNEGLDLLYKHADKPRDFYVAASKFKQLLVSGRGYDDVPGLLEATSSLYQKAESYSNKNISMLSKRDMGYLCDKLKLSINGVDSKKSTAILYRDALKLAFDIWKEEKRGSIPYINAESVAETVKGWGAKWYEAIVGDDPDFAIKEFEMEVNTKTEDDRHSYLDGIGSDGKKYKVSIVGPIKEQLVNVKIGEKITVRGTVKKSDLEDFEKNKEPFVYVANAGARLNNI